MKLFETGFNEDLLEDQHRKVLQLFQEGNLDEAKYEVEKYKVLEAIESLGEGNYRDCMDLIHECKVVRNTAEDWDDFDEDEKYSRLKQSFEYYPAAAWSEWD